MFAKKLPEERIAEISENGQKQLSLILAGAIANVPVDQLEKVASKISKADIRIFLDCMQSEKAGATNG